MFDDYKIGAALINKYFKSIESNEHDADDIAREMLDRKLDLNKFAKIIQQTQFQSQIKHFVEVNLPGLNLPIFDKDDFRKITLGSYQIKQILPYCVEVLERDGQFFIYSCPNTIIVSYFEKILQEKNVNEPSLLLTKMYSRHSKRRKYSIYVLFDKSKIGSSSIIEYCCECRHGLRKIGCCGHIIAFVAYVTYFHHNPREIKKVASFMNNYFVPIIPDEHIDDE